MSRSFPRFVAASVIAFAAAHMPAALYAQTDQLPAWVLTEYGTPPDVPEGPVPAELAEALDVVFVDALDGSLWGPEQEAALELIAASGDARLAWIIADMMRFTWRASFDDALAEAGARLLGFEYEGPFRWRQMTDYLLAWDLPAYPGYLDHKRSIFTKFVPGWEALFVPGEIDWRQVSWGGVLIDARPYDETDIACNCIPAADNPAVTSAEEATWLSEDDIVFGIVLNGEARAYPRQIMEVREMVNDTLGGRDLGIPYCTLCGAMQAWFTDELPEGVERPILRTTGLLIRSNKVMYDLRTNSIFDTFLGTAVTGPLAEKGVQLEQATVITTDWASWRAEYPDTTVLAEYLALGRDFDFRNGRDANGPIFPVGDVDPRLEVHEDVVGVITGSGTPVAFPRVTAIAALRAGVEVGFEDVRLEMSAGGLRALGPGGTDLGSHEAFWFAWSQFHPGTALWQP